MPRGTHPTPNQEKIQSIETEAVHRGAEVAQMWNQQNFKD